MEIPKYIEKALTKRAAGYAQASKYDRIVYEWLRKNNIEVEDYDILGGYESIVNPYSSSNSIRECILNTGGKRNEH